MAPRTWLFREIGTAALHRIQPSLSRRVQVSGRTVNCPSGRSCRSAGRTWRTQCLATRDVGREESRAVHATQRNEVTARVNDHATQQDAEFDRNCLSGGNPLLGFLQRGTRNRCAGAGTGGASGAAWAVASAGTSADTAKVKTRQADR